MILAVVGDRYYSDYSAFSKILRDEMQRTGSTEIVTGDATGVDTMALDYAQQNGIQCTVFCASSTNYTRLNEEGVRAILVSDWRKMGKVAGPVRNYRVLKTCSQALLFDGGGPGSANVKILARKLGKSVERWVITGSTLAGGPGTHELTN